MQVELVAENLHLLIRLVGATHDKFDPRLPWFVWQEASFAIEPTNNQRAGGNHTFAGGINFAYLEALGISR